MNNAEAVTLCRLAKAACPQQQFDEYTPDAWFELLQDMRFEDAKDALFDVCRRQPFVSPAEIRGAITNVRHTRLVKFGRVHPPSGMFGDKEWSKEIAWIKAVERRVANGDLTREQWAVEFAALEVECGATPRELPDFETVTRRVE